MDDLTTRERAALGRYLATYDLDAPDLDPDDLPPEDCPAERWAHEARIALSANAALGLPATSWVRALLVAGVERAHDKQRP